MDSLSVLDGQNDATKEQSKTNYTKLMKGLKTNKTTINDDHSHTENGHLYTH